MLYSRTIETPIGEMLACAAKDGICLLMFTDSPDLNSELEKLQEACQSPLQEQTHVHLDLLETQLKAYFEGAGQTFSVPLCPAGTDFQKKVWSQLQRIGYGKTISYKEQAQALGDLKALRAVASANGANKVPIIIPCHRVVGAKGSLTGYSGGLWRKKFLLDLESAQQKMKFI